MDQKFATSRSEGSVAPSVPENRVYGVRFDNLNLQPGVFHWQWRYRRSPRFRDTIVGPPSTPARQRSQCRFRLHRSCDQTFVGFFLLSGLCPESKMARRRDDFPEPKTGAIEAHSHPVVSWTKERDR